MSNIVKLPEAERGGFNLSRWAILHRSLTRFLVVLMVALVIENSFVIVEPTTKTVAAVSCRCNYCPTLVP